MLQLNKDLFTKEEELQKVRKDLDASELWHLKDVKLLKEEHQDKETQWGKIWQFEAAALEITACQQETR